MENPDLSVGDIARPHAAEPLTRIPEQDIHAVLEGLFLGTVAAQTATVARYFLPDASFANPLCRVPPFTSLSIPGAAPLNSAWAILMIYRLYRVVFPKIEFCVESCVFDRSACVLYLTQQHTLTTWFPPTRRRPVRLVSILQLQALDKRSFAPDSSNAVRDATECGECTVLAGAGHEEKGVLYFIAAQRDYGQAEDAAGLLAFGLGRAACRALKALGTVVCVLGAVVCMPVYCLLWPRWVSEQGPSGGVDGVRT